LVGAGPARLEGRVKAVRNTRLGIRAVARWSRGGGGGGGGGPQPGDCVKWQKMCPSAGHAGPDASLTGGEGEGGESGGRWVPDGGLEDTGDKKIIGRG